MMFVLCPKCGTKVTATVTVTEKKDYDAAEGCAGLLCFGPLGLLCGNKLGTVTREAWHCHQCQYKFYK
jgi:DNA-directed RNA polymerase subunit RPC12/RpoP